MVTPPPPPHTLHRQTYARAAIEGVPVMEERPARRNGTHKTSPNRLFQFFHLGTVMLSLGFNLRVVESHAIHSNGPPFPP